MKIGILTLPLHNNYGGILQNYALQRTLINLGHEAVTINRVKNMSLFRRTGSILKRLPLKIVNRSTKIRVWQSEAEKKIISQNTLSFIDENIHITDKITSTKKLETTYSDSFDLLVVGSDQVWRKRYSPRLSNYFLDFLVKNSSAKKVAYGSSFGVEEWEYSKIETAKYKTLIKKFDAVSVREDSAVTLCKKQFNIDVTHVLDPTLLLEKNDYVKLVDSKRHNVSSGNLFVYILDKSEQISEFIHKISKETNLKHFEVLPELKFQESRRKTIEKCIFPSVEKWIRAFMDAELIITDSYHGTIFSLIFQKPFLTVGNTDRGLSRFTSLLSSLNLSNRLLNCDDLDNYSSVLHEQINWCEVNSLLKCQKEHSLKFIKEYIK